MKTIRRDAIAWLELVLVLAIVTLILQLFPSVWWWLVGAVDMRKWSRWTWFVVNLAVIALLVAIRLAPEMTDALARRRAEKAKRRQRDKQKRHAEKRRERAAGRRRIRW